MFCNNVYITTSNDLQNFDLYYSFREYFKYKNNKKRIKNPSKLSSGYTLRSLNIDINYFDNLHTTRFNDVFISLKFILPKINFLEKYEEYKLDNYCDVIISNEKYNIHESEYNENNINEALMLIFPPKKYIKEYTGGNLIFKLLDKEYIIDTTQFSYEFYTIIIYDKINIIYKPIIKGYRCIFKSVIQYN